VVVWWEVEAQADGRRWCDKRQRNNQPDKRRKRGTIIGGGVMRGGGAGGRETVVWQEATQQPARQEAQEGRNERRWCNERRRRRQTRGGSMTRVDTTTSQSGQQDGHNKGVQQEVKAWQELDTPADGSCQSDSPVLRLCFNTKGKKGGLGRMLMARNICVILRQSLGGGQVGCDILEGYYISD
jgi:hypothetical protein